MCFLGQNVLHPQTPATKCATIKDHPKFPVMNLAWPQITEIFFFSHILGFFDLSRHKINRQHFQQQLHPQPPTKHRFNVVKEEMSQESILQISQLQNLQ
jgi:hypothetical protein